MNGTSFNLVNFLIGLAVGWFLLAFLHALVVTLVSAGGAELIPRFQAIAFFRDRKGALIDVILILGIGTVSTLAWVLAHRP